MAFRRTTLVICWNISTAVAHDALGVWPTQADALVDEVLGLLHMDGDQTVEYRDQSMSMRNWLKKKRELTVLTRPFLTAHAERSATTELRAAVTSPQSGQLARMLETWQLPDLLSRYPAAWVPQDLIAALRPLMPRMYSIASSSLLTDGEEVHLTVAHVDYRYEGAHRWGVASDYLAHREEGPGIDIFIETNERFRLPSDSDRDIIMIGPGAGIAPFRAFVQERAATGAKGHNWLFFGNRHFPASTPCTGRTSTRPPSSVNWTRCLPATPRNACPTRDLAPSCAVPSRAS
jgi:sulfite reductase (NADPH) flavoprotein alpha-component